MEKRLRDRKNQAARNRNECSLFQEKQKGSVTKANEPSEQVVGDEIGAEGRSPFMCDLVGHNKAPDIIMVSVTGRHASMLTEDACPVNRVYQGKL